MADDLSLFGVQKEADELWQELEEETAATDWVEVDVYCMVRIAPSVPAGIVATANEHDANPRGAAPKVHACFMN